MPTTRRRLRRARRSGALHPAVYELLMLGEIADEGDRQALRFWPENHGFALRFRRDDPAHMAAAWRENADAIREEWFRREGNTPDSRRRFRERATEILDAEAAFAPIVAARAEAQRVAIAAEAAGMTPTKYRELCAAEGRTP